MIVEEAPTSTMPVYVKGGAVKAINLPESMKLGEQMHDNSGDEYEAIPSLLITPPDASRESTIYVKDGESTDFRTYNSHTEVYTNTPGEGVSFSVTNEAGSPRQIVLALGVTAAAVTVDGESLQRLDHTPDYLSEEFGYVVDADGTTTMLLPSGWKELTVVKGDANYEPLTVYGENASMDTMLDGNPVTTYTVDRGFEVALDEPVEIDRIKVKWATGYYDSYDIEYSEDGEEWYTISNDAGGKNTVIDGCGSVDDICFDAVTAQYLRFVMREVGDAAMTPAVYELEVYAPVDFSDITILPEEEDPSLDENEWDDSWDDDDFSDDEDAGSTVRKKLKKIIRYFPMWLIIVIVAAVVLALTGLIFLFLLLAKRKKKKQEEALEAAEEAEQLTDSGIDFPNI